MRGCTGCGTGIASRDEVKVFHTVDRTIERASAELEGQPPERIIEWALREVRPLGLACSFSPEDLLLLDLLRKTDGGDAVKVFYIDTGLFFKETYELIERAGRHFGIAFIPYYPALTLEEQAALHGEVLWRTDAEKCCALRKVEPLNRALGGLSGWITGLRREQSPTRRNIRVVERDAVREIVKVNPLAAWSHEQVWDHVHRNSVPYNPLHERGYPSIGCWPCTTPVKPGEDPRSGRWRGIEKKECGLHYPGGDDHDGSSG